jgi:hypothetical protein
MIKNYVDARLEMPISSLAAGSLLAGPDSTCPDEGLVFRI